MDDSGLQRVPLTRIAPSRWQPRETAFDAERLWELACSIKENDLINPVVVFPVQAATPTVEDDAAADAAEEPRYELVAGERRCRAVLGLAWAAVDEQVTEKAAIEVLATGGLTSIPDEARAALVAGGDIIEWANGWSHILARVESGETDEDLRRLHRLAVVENIERESLSPIEEARALQGLADEFGWSQRVLARHIGKSQSYVAQRLSLLGLAEEAQEAVSTRVLTATHARAIASVPEELQPVVTEHVVAAVQRNDSPATTRQVQNLARQVAAFVDPARWEPNEERVYSPTQRNRLALIRWALEKADLEACAERLMGLRSVDWSDTNLLGKKPVALVDSQTHVDEVLQALIGDGQAHDWWEEFADEAGRACGFCVLDAYEVDGTDPDSSMRPYCPRWKNDEGNIVTCERFIGPDDPVVIALDGWGYSRTRDLMEEVGATFEAAEGFVYARSIPDYVKAYELAAELEKTRRAERKQERETGHVDDIRAFMDWLATLPGEIHAHFQAQTCAKCANCALACDPPCYFVENPLDSNTWNRRAPVYAVLVTKEGQVLPRCAEFAYADTPALYTAGKEKLGRKTRAAEWLEAIAKGHGYSNSRTGLPGVLRWLDYGRSPDGDDFDKLKRFVKREWDELGGDAAVATLIDVALHEARAVRGRSTLKLLNAVTGEVEEFAAVRFETVLNGTDPAEERWSFWPKGFPAPWVETIDAGGNPNEA